MKDRLVLVTGGARGIGRAITAALLEAGARVAVADTDEAAMRVAARRFDRTGRCALIRADVSVEAEVRAFVAGARKRFGPVRGVVHNAGIMSGMGTPLGRLSLEDWNRVLAVNLTAGFLVVKHAAADLRKKGGAVVHIASTRAFQSEPDTEAYAASKGGLVALAHAMAASLGPRVRVNAVCPGWIDTAAWREGTAPRLRRVDHAQHPAGRVGVPEDVAGLVLYLLSGRAGFITGQAFTVDGGMTTKMIYEA